MTFRLIFACVFSILPLSTVIAQDWSYEFEPYILASSIEGDSRTGRTQGVDVDVNFGDILEVLDTGLMGHFEAQSDTGWGLVLDYGYMDLRDDIAGPRGGVASVRVRQGVLEALVTRRSSNNDALEYFAGVRWWDNDLDLRVDPAILPGTPATGINVDWVDIVFGARLNREISDQWSMQLRGDVGGFGIEADFTSTVSIGFRRTISDRFDLNLQYKATWVDYEQGTPGQAGYYLYDTVTHGPQVGLAIKF
ncbi:MAG: hypothetical protein ACR2QG_12585 [Gammaproteobacteria bacterium]